MSTNIRYRVHWITEHDVLVDVGSPEERATSTCTCIIEQWSDESADWIAADDDRVRDAIDALREGDDWESPDPYDDAKARLLAKAGLTEADLTDPDCDDW